MSKFTNSVLIIFFAVVCGIDARGKEYPVTKMYEDAIAICKPKTGVSEDEINKMLEYDPPVTHEGTCFMGCMKKQFGIMNEENRVNLTIIALLSEPLKTVDPHMHFAINDVSIKCEREVPGGPDECYVAQQLVACAMLHAKEMGVQFPLL